jgi:hypothetical protein
MSFITPGIKYIKVSKFDSEGRNNTTSLREITDLRLNTNDNGFINYPIVARTEYEDYFLLQTVTTNITSSTNNQILDYQVDVQNTIAFTFDPSTGAGFDLIEYNIENSNPLGYMDVGSGEYTLGNTPNIPIIITASADWDNNFFGVPQSTRPIVSLRRIISPFQNQIILSSTAPSPSLTGTVTLTGSFTPIENEVYGIFVSDLIDIDPTRFVGNTLIITQSQSPVAGIGSQVIIEPYLPVPFTNSDYNAIINNAVTSRPNENFFDVDFSSNQFTAVNEASIISASRGVGFATPSTVPQSNYTTARIINPRYIGKELTSAEFNTYTNGDVAYGKTSNVGNPAVNFVFFEYLSGTTPEWGNFNEGKTFVNIKYIIDENGNITKPLNDSEGINLGTIQQTFNGKDGAIILLDNNDAFGVNFGELNGLQSVFKSGYRIEPIIYTQIGGSGLVFTSEIRFAQGEQDGNPSKNDYRLLTQAIPQTLTTNPNTFELISTPTIISFNFPTILGESGSFNTTTNIYNPIGSPSSLVTEGYILFGEAYLEAVDGNYEEAAGGQIIPTTVTYQIQKSIDGGLNWEILREKNIEYRSGTSSDFSLFGNDGKLIFSDSNSTTSSLYRVVASNVQKPFRAIDVILSTNAYFKITQFPNPNTGQCDNFWEIGSSPNRLLAIEGITGLNNYIGQQQIDISGSGFFPIVNTFNPQPFDEIRFQGLEILSFVILNVGTIIDEITSRERLELILDRNIPVGVDLNNFLLRRYVPDPSIIILNTSKDAGGTSTGILKPQYISPVLDSKIDSIILDLKTKNII